MWEHNIRMPARWLQKHEAMAYLGLSEVRFNRLVTCGLIGSRGKGAGLRYDAAHVYAVGELWRHLSPLLNEEDDGEKAE